MPWFLLTCNVSFHLFSLLFFFFSFLFCPSFVHSCLKFLFFSISSLSFFFPSSVNYIYMSKNKASCTPIRLTYLLTYLLHGAESFLRSQPANLAASQEIPRIYGTRKFLTVPTSDRHPSLSWANSIQSPRPPSTSWRSILILSSHLRLGLLNGIVTAVKNTTLLK